MRRARPRLIWLVVPAVLLAAGFVAARWTRRWADVRRVGLAALLTVVAVLAISRADEPRAYTFQWRIVIAAFVVVASLWAVAGAVDRFLPGIVRTVGVVSLVALLAWGVISPNVRPRRTPAARPEASSRRRCGR